MNKCTICDCDFSEDDGVVGTLGVIEVEFCNYCLVALEDMLGQKKELEKQDEPVAYINVEKRKLEWAKPIVWETPTVVNLPKIPLYTKPQTKEWVSLTDEQIVDLVIKNAGFPTKLAKDIEAKLKEKNALSERS